MDDIKDKLRRIKFHRIVIQIKNDIYDYMGHNTPTMGIEKYLSDKYPNIEIDLNQSFDEKTKIWNFNVTIHKPIHFIETVFKVTPTGVKYNN
jgi:hypothetical protein